MSKKTNNSGSIHISLSKKSSRIKSLTVTIALCIAFIVAVVLALLAHIWAFVISLILPVAIYISIKVTIAVYKRGVDLKGDIVQFEPEYRYFVKFNKRELAKIYVKDPKTNKECEASSSYKNKEIIFQLKNKEKYGYCLPQFTNDDIIALKNTLMG